MLAEYVPVLVSIVIALVFGAVALTVGFVLGPRHSYAEKDSPYECGLEASEDARMLQNKIRRTNTIARQP